MDNPPGSPDLGAVVLLEVLILQLPCVPDGGVVKGVLSMVVGGVRAGISSGRWVEAGGEVWP